MILNKNDFQDPHVLRMLTALEQGVAAVQPSKLFSQCIRFTPAAIHIQDTTYPISGRVFVIGAGKAGLAMSEALYAILGNTITAGWVNALRPAQVGPIKISEATHPYPSAQNISATHTMLEQIMQATLTPKDTVICLISGGGSALLTLPADGITIDDLQTINKRLINSGATIQEINTVRKHLSHVKGGLLAQHCAPAQLITLIISDVIGNDPSTIASGITVADTTTYQDARAILTKYKLDVPQPVSDHITQGCNGNRNETPIKLHTNVHILADNSTICEAVARSLGDVPTLPNLTGDINKVATTILTHPYIVFGGEPTIAITGMGKGGRAMHLTALLGKTILGKTGAVACIGSDGQDFIKGIAGACISSTLHTISPDYDTLLRNNDSYCLHKELGSLLKANPTGTNVCDVGIYMCK